LRELKALVWRGRDIHLVVQRARIVLLAHEGHGTEEIARAVGWTARAVRKCLGGHPKPARDGHRKTGQLM
jgi:predicted transcriptional regulator